MSQKVTKRTKRQLRGDLFRAEILLHCAGLHLADRAGDAIRAEEAKAIADAHAIVMRRLRQVRKEQKACA